MKNCNVLFISSEAEPYAKSGGLADVVSALPKALVNHDINVKVVIPLYRSIDYDKYKLKPVLSGVCVKMGGCEEWFSVHYTNYPNGVDIYFIEFDKYFNRDGFYHDENGEFGDNLERFSFLCMSALQLAIDIGFKPDIVHVHDWQTCLAPYYIKQNYNEFFKDTKTVLTIHNMGYQGTLSSKALYYAKIHTKDFSPDKFEAFGAVNLLKGGIYFADKITTVSPTYANEIKGDIGGCGLAGYIRMRGWDLTGILNGVDTDIWNPQTDNLIKTKFSRRNYKKGKIENKAEIQQRLNIEKSPDIPLFGVISRFASQKGLEMLKDAAGLMLSSMKCQLAIIGSGDPELERFFREFPKYLRNAGSYIGYNEELAHLLEAGSDFFIMPSLYEPCGLNQMYSQIYGTLPVVRNVGGLADTVEQYNEVNGTGTGFKFNDISSKALLNTIGWAVSTYFDRPAHIDNMIKSAMKKDFSWNKSALEYIKLYKSLVPSMN